MELEAKATSTEPEVPVGAKRRPIGIWIKAVGSAVLLAVVFSQVSLRDVAASIRTVSIPLLILAASLHVVGYLVSCIRWRILLAGLGCTVPLGTLVSSYLVGSFFNSFLPTTVGGDVVRVMDTSRHTSTANAAASVLVERATGIGALLVMAGAALLVAPSLAATAPAAGIAALLFAVLGALFVILGWGMVRTGLARRVGKLGKLLMAVAMYGRSRRELIVASLLGVVLQVNVALHYYLLSAAFHQNVSPWAFLLITPVLTVVLMLPVSINGVGLREAAFVQLMKPFGVSNASAVALSVTSYALITLCALVGGVVYLFRTVKPFEKAETKPVL
jgi:uncharacterized membrane protein YbhN (UPF0104 family)